LSEPGADLRSSRPPSAAVSVGVAVTLVACLAIYGANWLGHRQQTRAAFPTVSGVLQVAGIRAGVEVLRDGRGIPHIRAEHELDAWTALGFVHAQDRLAQMLWLRRLARGTTAEVVGERGLDSDRLARLLGIGRLADAQLAELSAADRAVLGSYADGVNARVERIRSGVVAPPVALRESIDASESWRASDSLALLKLISWSAGTPLETGLVMSDLIQRLGGVAARPFFPIGEQVSGVDVSIRLPPPAESAARGARNGKRMAARPMRFELGAASILGSSAFVVSGRSSASGAPLLVADLHLSPTAPSLIYEAHVEAGELRIAGASVPGLPIFWAGRNPDVAWASTPARIVTVDLYRETLREGEEARYQNGSRWVPIRERSEIVRVRGAAGVRDEMFTVRSTGHGPLVNDIVSDGAEREPLALAWTGALPGNGFSSLMALSRAKSADELVAALRTHHEPALAVVYADRQGTAGLQVAGWIPRRVLPTGLVPVPGRLRVFRWRTPVPFEELPAERLGDAGGWLIASDNSLPRSPDGPLIEWLWRTGERSRRLDQLLHELRRAGPIDLRSATAVQVDRSRVVAVETIQQILALAGQLSVHSPESREVAGLLAGWDGVMKPGSAGALVYHMVLDQLARELFAQPMGEALLRRYSALPHTRSSAVVERILEVAAEDGHAGGWADRERVRDAVARALRQTWVRLSYRLGPNRERWDWGRMHRVEFRPFAALEPGAPAGTPTFPLGGDGDTLALAEPDPSRAFAVRGVSAYRIAVDLAAPDRMLSGLAPGQSEHPRHPHFDDGLVRWLEGRPSLLVTSRLLVEEASSEGLVLEPAQ